MEEAIIGLSVAEKYIFKNYLDSIVLWFVIYLLYVIYVIRVLV
jgi:hypothetical protein